MSPRTSEPLDEWRGLADLLANLIEKYAAELDIENLPAPNLGITLTKDNKEPSSLDSSVAKHNVA